MIPQSELQLSQEDQPKLDEISSPQIESSQEPQLEGYAPNADLMELESENSGPLLLSQSKLQILRDSVKNWERS